MYVLKGCRSLTHIREQDSDTHLKVVFTVGLAQATLMQCVYYIHGAYMNPAITLTMIVTGEMELARVVCYLLVLCCGAIAGAGILRRQQSTMDRLVSHK